MGCRLSPGGGRRIQGSKVPWMCRCNRSPKTWPKARKGLVEDFFPLHYYYYFDTHPSSSASRFVSGLLSNTQEGRAPPSRCKVIRPVGESCRAPPSGSLCLTRFHQLVMTLAATSQPTHSNGEGRGGVGGAGGGGGRETEGLKRQMSREATNVSM